MYQNFSVSLHCEDSSQLSVEKCTNCVSVAIGQTRVDFYRPQNEKLSVDEWIELLADKLRKLVKPCGELSESEDFE